MKELTFSTISQDKPQYDAFVSYRRKDGSRHARTLRRRLLEFKLPPGIEGAEPNKKLNIYLDTIYETANEDFFSSEIAPALANSRLLIVVQTPEAFKRRVDGSQSWVEREIEVYRSGGDKRPIAVALAKGQFEDPLPASLHTIFPLMDRVDIRRITSLNPMASTDMVVPLIAAMHRVPSYQMPLLRMEEARLQSRRKRNFAVSTSLLALLVFSTILLFLLFKRGARSSRSARFAAVATENLQKDPELALRLSIEAVQSNSSFGDSALPASEAALRRALIFPIYFRLRDTVSDPHKKMINRIAFDPAGRLLAVSGEDGRVKIWDETMRKVLVVLDGRGDSLNGVTFSRDGKSIATASEDGHAKIWDVASGRELATIATRQLSRSPISGHNDNASGHTPEAVVDVAFSNDGRMLIMGLGDGAGKAWNIALAKELFTFQGHKGGIERVIVSPDGELIATGGADGYVRLWQVSNGRLVSALHSENESIADIAFSANGEKLAIGNDTAELWDVSTKKQLTVLKSQTAPVFSVSFSHDDEFVFIGDADGSIKALSAETGQEIYSIRGHSNVVTTIASKPDGNVLATGSSDSTVKLWDINLGHEVLALRGHSGNVSSLAFSQDGTLLASAGFDKTARIWDATKGEQLRVMQNKDIVSGIAFSPDGRRFATDRGNEAVVWDTKTGQNLQVFAGHSAPVNKVVFDSRGNRLATSSADGTAKIWDVSSGQILHSLSSGAAPVYGVAFSPDGGTLATASYSDRAELWDTKSGKKVKVFVSRTGPIFGLGFSPSGEYLVTASRGSVANTWNVADGRELVTLLGHSNEIERAIFSPDGKQIATSSADNSVIVYDAKKGQALITLAGNAGIAYSPEGKHLAAATADGTIQIYALKISELLELGRQRLVRTVRAFSKTECNAYFPQEKCPNFRP